MDLNVEKEYKILLSEEQFKLLASNYPANYILQKNTYYDNENSDIAKRRCAMRIRTKDEKCEFTFKAPTKDGDKFEFSCQVDKDDPSCFSNVSSIYLLLEERQVYGPFHAIGTTNTKRNEIDLGDAYLCFDITKFDDDSFDYEIEYEYKKDHDGFTAFNKILSTINVEYKTNCLSKIRRCIDRKKD